MIEIRLLLLVLVVLLHGCGTVAPVLTMKGSLSPESERSLYVTATKQKSIPLASLRRSGFTIAGDLLAAPYQLRITLGVDKAFRDCGTLNNVKYSLRSEGRPVLEISGRGWTGSCDPNIFDEMSQLLMRKFRVGTAAAEGE